MADVPAVKNFGQVLTAKSTLTRMKNMIPQGAGVTAEQICSVVMAQVRQNPDLVNKCDHNSLLAACFDVAKSGLIPDGILGQAYIVPFKGEAQFIPGYRGLITLAMNSGQIQEIWAREVRQNDRFIVHEGTDHKIEHHVDYTRPLSERGKIVAFYAVAHFRHGGKAFEIMSVDEVDAIREQAPGKNSPAWRNHYGEMGKKTVLRRLAKWLPQSVQRFTQMEENFEATGQVTHLNDDMTLEAAPGSWQETTPEDTTVPAREPEPEPEQEQPAKANGNGQGQQAKSNGSGQSKSKQSPRAAAAVGESKRKPGRPKKNPEPEPEPEPEQPAAEEQPADDTPHDPETGEVQDAEEVSEQDSQDGQDGQESNIHKDVSGVPMQRGKRGPLTDQWFEAVIDRLNELTTEEEVRAFWSNNEETIKTIGEMSESYAEEANSLFRDRLGELASPY